MSLAFKDDPIQKNQKQQVESSKIRFVEEHKKDEIRKRYMPRHSHAGFIVAIIILSILVIAGPVGMFFWAKGLGWDEAIANRGQEMYDDGYNRGYNDGNSNGWSSGWSAGRTNGYSAGFEDARNCAQRIIIGTLHDSIYTCYK